MARRGKKSGSPARRSKKPSKGGGMVWRTVPRRGPPPSSGAEGSAVALMLIQALLGGRIELREGPPEDVVETEGEEVRALELTDGA